MNGSASKVAPILAAILSTHILLILGGGVATLVLLFYAGVALPAVWSAKPARRKAAAAVLRDVLAAIRRV